MLSKAKPSMESGRNEPSLSPEEKADLKIASSLLTTSLLSDEGEQALVSALSSPEPAKAVAVIISQIIEMAQTESGQTDIPMTPTVWLMEGGAVDNAEEDIARVAQVNGIELPDDFEELVIDEVAAILMKRREDILSKQQGGRSQPSGGGSPPSPAPVPGQPMGGTPNGMG